MHVLQHPHLPRLISLSIAATVLAIVISLALAASVNNINPTWPRDEGVRPPERSGGDERAARIHPTPGGQPFREPSQSAAAAALADRARP